MESLVRITRIKREAFYRDLIERDTLKKKRLAEPQLPLSKLSIYIGGRKVTPAGEPVPECVTCGVCCAYLLFVPVTAKDSERLGEYVELTLDDSETEIAVDRLLPRDAESGHCTHLAGNLGEQIGCRIYEDRPHACRDFDAGSDRCHEYRRIYGIEPRLTDDEVVAALAAIANSGKKERIADVQFIQEATVSGFSFSLNDAESVAEIESVQLKIMVFLGDKPPQEIHRFEAGREIWFESDFLSLTLAEAQELIASRQTQELN